MSDELTYRDEAAAGYERAFAHISMHFVPLLLRAAQLTTGMRVLDIATGTGLAAEAALTTVGLTGHVTAADISPAMVEKARERLGKTSNAMVPAALARRAISGIRGSYPCPFSKQHRTGPYEPAQPAPKELPMRKAFCRQTSKNSRRST